MKMTFQKKKKMFLRKISRHYWKLPKPISFPFSWVRMKMLKKIKRCQQWITPNQKLTCMTFHHPIYKIFNEIAYIIFFSLLLLPIHHIWFMNEISRKKITIILSNNFILFLLLLMMTLLSSWFSKHVYSSAENTPPPTQPHSSFNKDIS